MKREAEKVEHTTHRQAAAPMRAWLKPEQHGRALVARLKTPA